MENQEEIDVRRKKAIKKRLKRLKKYRTLKYKKENISFNKMIFNIEEVEKEIQIIEEMYLKKSKEVVKKEKSNVLGFDTIGHFCKLEVGYIVSSEDICPYCVNHIVSNFGTKEERLKLIENSSFVVDNSRKAIAKRNKLIKEQKKIIKKLENQKDY